MARLTESESRHVRELLASCGINHAWELQIDDDGEVVIMVLDEQLKSVDVSGLTEQVMALVPHRKVWVAKYRSDLQSTRIF